jgi:hypothetical protein
MSLGGVSSTLEHSTFEHTTYVRRTLCKLCACVEAMGDERKTLKHLRLGVPPAFPLLLLYFPFIADILHD